MIRAMKYSLISASFAAILLFGSCSTISNTAYTAQVDTQVVNVTVADLDVSKDKVTATYSWNWNPFKKVSSYKDAALSQALNQSGSDVIVEPIYEVHHRGIMRGGSVTVSGYPAKFINFHPMTSKEANVIDILNGKQGVAATHVKTSLPTLLSKFKPKKESAPKLKTGGQFVSLTMGMLIFDGTVGEHFDLGLMYGRYGTRWGWYGKIDLAMSSEYNSKVMPALTFGAIKTISNNFRCFLGAGVGGALYNDWYAWSYYGEERTKADFGIPFEAGVQWNIKHLNLLAGFQFMLNTQHTDECNYKPYLGIGYTF